MSGGRRHNGGEQGSSGSRTRRLAAGPDAAVALALALGSAAVYAATSHADWIFDSLRYADYTQRGDLESLLLLLHALANLVPLAAFEGLSALGYEGGSLPVIEAFAVAGAACAVALVYLGARGMGVSIAAAVAASMLFAASLGVWRGAASAGVYGLTLAALALAWLAAIRFGLGPSRWRALALGGAAGLALATHLATISFLLVALGLAAAAPAARGRERAARTGAVGAAAAAVAAPLLLLAAGLARDWSPGGIGEWFLGPHVPEADPSRTVGFGLDGLVPTIASEQLPSATFASDLAVVATLALVALAGAGAAFRLRADGRARAVAGALGAGAVIAVFAAGWYQAERPDYFSLALVPLALLWASGIEGIMALIGRRAVAIAVVPIAAAGLLAAWNLEGEVGETLDRARQREAAAHAIAAAVPSEGRVLLSPQIAPRAAYDGLRAQTGWAALLQRVGESGDPRRGLRAYLAAEATPVFVSSRAFELTPAQAEYLGAGGPELWRRLGACGRPVAVAEFVTDAGPESLFRIGRCAPGRPADDP